MKLAIILCGQIRTFNLTKWLLENIKNKYECDIFMGIDPNNLNQNEDLNNKNPDNKEKIEQTIEFVKPKKVYIFDETKFNKSFNNLDFYMENNVPINQMYKEELITKENNTWIINKPFLEKNNKFYKNNTKINDYIKIFRQYFLVNECYKMLVNHINEYNKSYDIIIKLRFDQLIWSGTEIWCSYNCKVNKKGDPCYNKENIELFKSISKNQDIEFIKQKDNMLSVFGCGTIKTYAYVNDQFWTHGMDLTEKMSKFYENLIHIVNQSNKEHSIYSGANIEHYLLRYLFNNNINIQKTNIGGRFIREFSC